MIDFTNIGYEYGIKPGFMIVGDIEFANNFQKANSNGVTYIFAYKENVSNSTNVGLGFLFTNDEYAEKFFTSLNYWVENSGNDGDAVAIDFIEKKNGTYAIAIYPELDRLMNRVIPKNLQDKVHPYFFVATQFHELKIGNNYLIFKKKYKKGDEIAIGYFIGSQQKIEKQSKFFFRKKEFNFYKEDNIPKDSMVSSYKSKKMKSVMNEKNIKKMPKVSLKEILKKREEELKSYFPITMIKLESQNWLSNFLYELKLKYEKDLIIQAICNLILFERLNKIENAHEIFKNRIDGIRILEYLSINYESFASYFPPEDFFSLPIIEKQIENDKRELENYLKE